MKFTTTIIATLAVAAAAQPYHRHHHPHPAKREIDIVTDIVTDIVIATQAAAIVYVNQAGQPLYTSYIDPPASTETSTAPASSSVSSQPTSVFLPPAPESTGESSGPANTPDQSPSQTSSASPLASSSTSSGGSSNGGNTKSFGYGLSYSPYGSDGNCKSQDQINDDFSAFTGYGFIRSYGVDCNQATTILSAVQAKGMKMFAGIYDINNVAAETQELIAAVHSNWDSVYAVSVGNEAINNGVATVSQVVAAVNQARSMLRAAGYTGPVVTVDTSSQIIANPQLCDASDFAAANCHAFFNADLTPDQAGPWVAEQAQRVQQACGGKDTMITESGWPNQGETNGMAIPSTQNAATAIKSLRQSFPNNIVLFSAFNNLWETNTPATLGTNQFWGIYGDAPS